MSNLNAKIESIVKKNFEDQVSFLQQLVQTKSSNPHTPETSSGEDSIEKEVAQVIYTKLEDLGCNPRFKGVSTERPNVVCKLEGNNPGAKDLILNGHMDTIVPPSDYDFDPYSGKIEDQKLYGVGAADMKASLSVFVFLVKAIKNLDIQLQGDVVLSFVVDEEPGGCSQFGTQYLLDQGEITGDAAIVAEPGTNKIAVGHRGGYRFKLTTYGESAHTGILKWEQGEKGKNAVQEMQRAIKLINKIEIPSEPSTHFPGRKSVFSFPTMISGGNSINIVPEKCEAYGDVRLLPNNDAQQIANMMERQLDKTSIDYSLEELLSVPAVKISTDEKIAQVLLENTQRYLDSSPKLEGSGPWNDGWMFIEEGIPAVCGFGPDGKGVHSKNEYVDLNSLRGVTSVYLKTVLDFVGFNSK